MVQAVEAVSQCSMRGVLHQDIKGENLLITDTLEVKLIDFGCGDLIKTIEYHRYTVNLPSSTLRRLTAQSNCVSSVD
ncbi:hypothetical protein MHYP_G00351620 [Metynnis hypsauchen]